MISKAANTGHCVSGGFAIKKAQPTEPAPGEAPRRRITDRRHNVGIDVDPEQERRHAPRRQEDADRPAGPQAQIAIETPEIQNIFTEANIDNLLSTSIRHKASGVFDLYCKRQDQNIAIGIVATGFQILKLLKLDLQARTRAPREVHGVLGPDPEENILYYVKNGTLVPNNLKTLKYQNLHHAFMIVADPSVDSETIKTLMTTREVEYHGIHVDADYAEASFRLAEPENYSFLKSAMIKALIIRTATSKKIAK